MAASDASWTSLEMATLLVKAFLLILFGCVLADVLAVRKMRAGGPAPRRTLSPLCVRVKGDPSKTHLN
jgi:hypothetical protein